MDNSLVLQLGLGLLLPMVLLSLCVLLFINIRLKQSIVREKRRLESHTLSTKRNNRRLYLIDRERK
jgi:hypothetical protein